MKKQTLGQLLDYAIEAMKTTDEIHIVEIVVTPKRIRFKLSTDSRDYALECEYAGSGLQVRDKAEDYRDVPTDKPRIH